MQPYSDKQGRVSAVRLPRNMVVSGVLFVFFLKAATQKSMSQHLSLEKPKGRPNK